MRQLRIRTVPALAFLACGLPSAGAAGQTAEEIVRTALDRNDSRTESVYNYTVTHEFLGFTSVSYFERIDVDGRWVFAPQVTATELGGSRRLQDQPGHLGVSAWADPFGHLLEWSRSAVLEGTETIDGVLNWVVRIDDFGPSEWGLTPGTYAEGVFRPSIGRLYLDRRTYLVNRFDVSGILLQQDGVTRPVRMVARLDDYRTLEGLTHPFTLQLDVYGLGLPGPDERTATQLLADLEYQLEELGSSDRAAVQALVDAQLTRYQEQLAGTTPLSLTVRVLDLRVNEGPPSS